MVKVANFGSVTYQSKIIKYRGAKAPQKEKKKKL